MSPRARRFVPTLALAVGILAVSAGCGDSAAQPEAAGQSGAPAASGPKESIVFAAVPSENSQSLRSQHETTVALIEKATGKKVEYQDATDYAAVIEGQRAGKIDLAMYGPFSYKIARDGGVPIEPLAAGVDEEGAEPGYHSTAWTRPDTGITSLEGMKGKDVCFVDPASTSGNLVPTGGLLEVGIQPEKDLKKIFAGAHDASMISVANKQCDAGFSQESMVPDLIEKGQLKDGQLTQIWKSDRIPGSPIAMNTKTLDAETQKKLREVFGKKLDKATLEAMPECEGGKCELPGDAEYGWAPVTDDTYAPIRKLCDLTKASACNSAG